MVSQGIQILKPKSLKIKQSWFELVSHTGSKQSWAFVDNLSKALFWDFKVLGKKVENWVKIRTDVRSKDLGAHTKYLSQVLLVYAFGLEEGDYGLDRVESS